MFGLRSRKSNDGSDDVCLVCKHRSGIVPIEGGKVCRYCQPLGGTYDLPTADEVRAGHMKDTELLARVDAFNETESLGDFRFDDGNRLFFRGPYPNYSIPVLSYTEIRGYTLRIDGRPVAFNSVDGSRAVMRPMTEEALRKASRETGTAVVEIETSRNNVKVRPYDVMKEADDSKEERFRIASAVSRKLDAIIEANLLERS